MYTHRACGHAHWSIEGFPICLCVGGSQLLTNCLILPHHPNTFHCRPISDVLRLTTGNNTNPKCASPTLLPKMYLLTSCLHNMGGNTGNQDKWGLWAQIELWKKASNIWHSERFVCLRLFVFWGCFRNERSQGFSKACLPGSKRKIWIQMNFHPWFFLIAFHTFPLFRLGVVFLHLHVSFKHQGRPYRQTERLCSTHGRWQQRELKPGQVGV